MFIVGIDIAKRSHEAIIIAEDGQVVRKAFSFRNNCTGYNLLLEQVRRLTLVKSQIVFAMESTAHYWLALYARLLKDGYTVMVLNPIQLTVSFHSCSGHSPTNGSRSLSLPKASTHSPSPAKSHTAAHRGKQGVFSCMAKQRQGQFLSLPLLIFYAMMIKIGKL